MNRAALSGLLLVLCTLPFFAQIKGTDTLFRADELTYFSTLEKKALSDYLEGHPDPLAMIAAVNPKTDERELELYRKWIYEIISEIRDKKFDPLSREKKISRIQKYVSKSLLINYNITANFDHLFRNGDFNYFTAAALYAFILDRFEIPYEIREFPSSIDLIAYPHEEKIRMETAQPGIQYFMFDYDTRENFVNFIHDMGVIDDQSYKNIPTRILFQQYFFTDYGLTIREMIGMLYINSAMERMTAKRMDDSYAQLEKAFILYPCYKTQYMLLGALNNHLQNMDVHNLVQLGYLAKASRLIGCGIDRNFIESCLGEIVDKVLVEEENPEGFAYIYKYLQDGIRDKGLMENFTFYYLHAKGKMEFLDARYEKALKNFESAYRIRPGDKANLDLLARSLGWYSLTASPVSVLEKIEHYDTAYAEIHGEAIYKLVKIHTYLALFGEAFQLKDPKTGEQYMLNFEELMDENPEAELDDYLIGRSYSSAAIYYYHQGMLEKSKQTIERGLGYAPDNFELKLKLDAFR